MVRVLADKRFRLLRLLPFRGLSVCLSVCLFVTFVHCARNSKDIDTICFACDIAMYPQIVLTFGLHRPTPSSPNFDPK